LKNDVKQSSAAYWDATVQDFDAIYSGERTRFGVVLDRWLRKDIYDRVHETVRLVDELGRGQRVLDVGTGTGRLCVPLARHSHEIVGVDFSASMLAKARQITKAAGVADRCSFIQDDLVTGGEKTLAGQRFDAIAILGVLDYISDPRPMMQRLLVTSPRMIVATFPREGTLRSWVRRLRYRLQGLDCPLYFYSKGDVVDVAGHLGMTADVRVLGQLHFAVFRR
jgi:ubiquinone/menaquinone biosynthesis C-methylase UbiE